MHDQREQTQIQALEHSVIQRLAVGPNRGRNIEQHEAEQIMCAILEGQIDPVRAAVILIALRMKGETEPELFGLLDAVQSTLTIKHTNQRVLFQLVDPFDGYTRSAPITPFVPSVLSACGLASYAIGLQTVGPKYGVTTHQVLSAAGAKVCQSTSHVASGIDQFGWGYLDQKTYSPKLANLLEFRDQLVKRTAITTIERTMRPLAGTEATHLVIGYVHKPYVHLYSRLAEHAGFSSSLLVKGVEGGFSSPLNKPLRTSYQAYPAVDSPIVQQFELPEQLGATQAGESMPQSELGDSLGRAQACLQIGLQALQGKHGIARQSLITACAPILQNHGYAKSFEDAVEIVQRCLDNGKAHSKFKQLVDFYC